MNVQPHNYGQHKREEPTVDELNWTRSTHCESGACVEVAPLPDGGMAVRDSKRPDGPVLRFTAAEWAAFVAGARAGEFDLD